MRAALNITGAALALSIMRCSSATTNVSNGSKSEIPSRVDVFRFASELGHCSTRSALRICARTGHTFDSFRRGWSKPFRQRRFEP
jgi:hypothetical protein